MNMQKIHYCELIHTSDFNLKKPSVNKNGCFLLFNLFRNWITVNEDHPKCRKYLISLAAVNNEKKRQNLNKHWWIIHPLSKIRFFWESFMMIIYLIAFITIPFFTCFVVIDHEKIRFDNVNLTLYFFFWMDIVNNCITGFYDINKDEVILDQGLIIKRYLRGYFFIDVFTSIPYDYIILPWRKFPGPDNSFVVTIISLMPLLKLSRYFTLTSYVKQMFLHIGIEDVSSQMFFTILLYTYVIHWFACFCNAMPLIMIYAQHIPAKDSGDLWLASDEVKGIARRYQRALFIVLENFTASGYGIIPHTEGQVAVCTIIMVLGRLFESYITIMLLQIIGDRKASESKYEQIVNQLCAYVRQKQLPIYMKRRLVMYYHHRFKDSYFREKKILSNLSSALRKEVLFHSCRRLIENVDIFQDLPKNVLTLIITNLKPELYLPNDVIIKAGTQGDCMYFLSSGCVSVATPTGKEICTLEDGAHFGEVALLVQDQRRGSSVVAIEVCEIYRFERKDFRKCIALNNDLFVKIERVATERMQRTLMIEEQHKRSMHARVSATSQIMKLKK